MEMTHLPDGNEDKNVLTWFDWFLIRGVVESDAV